MKTLIGIVLAAVVLAGCAGGDDPGDGPSTGTIVEPSPGSTAGATEDTGEPSAEETPAEAADLAFGETFAYEDGLEVSVSPPEVFAPSATSVNGGEPDFVTFQVTVVNGTGAEIAPGDVFVTVQSADGEGGEVLDPDGGVPGAPAEPVASGAEASWPLAFGVMDGTDVLVRVQPGIDADPVRFGG